MRFISPLLKSVVYPTLSAAAILRRAAAGGLAILTYHGVLPAGYEPMDPVLDGTLISADILRRQLRFLRAHYNLISPQETLAFLKRGDCLPKRAVLLTCDDGRLNCLTDMLPILRESEVTCLFFVTGVSAEDAREILWYEELLLLFLRAPEKRLEISAEGIEIRGELGSREQRRELWWDSVKRLSQLDSARRKCFMLELANRFGFDVKCSWLEKVVNCRRFGLLTRSELRELASAGMTIGAHTMSHPMLSQMPPELAYTEISESRKRLESVLDRPVWAFAYPFGDPQSVTGQVLSMPQSAGYEAAFLNFGGGLGTELRQYALPRIHISADMGLAELEARVSGFHERWQRRVTRNRHAEGTIQEPR